MTDPCPKWHFLRWHRDINPDGPQGSTAAYACSRANTHTVQAAAQRMNEEHYGRIMIVGSRHRLGKSPIKGWGSAGVGYTMACTCGQWVLRLNGNKRAASRWAREHLREVHGLRGQAAADALRF